MPSQREISRAAEMIKISELAQKYRNTISGPKKCFVIGATGEVGKCLLKELVKSNAFDTITIYARREISEFKDNNVVSQHIVEDFSEIKIPKDHNIGFSAMGSTRAKAGSAKEFRRIDHDLPLSVAKSAKASGTQWFGVVSSVGASADSYFLYNQVKGELERDLEKLNFDCLRIYRPGMLLCDREESRALERIGRFFAPILNVISGSRSGVSTSAVAKCMISDALNDTIDGEAKGTTIRRSNKEICEFQNL